MKNGYKLSALAIAIMASSSVAANVNPEPDPVNSPFIKDAKGNIIEDQLKVTRTGTIKNTDQQLIALSLFSAYITITYEPTDGFIGYYDQKCEMKN